MKIVVVEDEPKSREGILNILARNTEYEVAAVCGNGKEGLEAVKKYRPDLVISDIKMPVMGGLEMLEKILEEGINVQAILLTGYSEFEYARRALKLQVVEYVLKPLEVEGFLEVLQREILRKTRWRKYLRNSFCGRISQVRIWIGSRQILSSERPCRWMTGRRSLFS